MCKFVIKKTFFVSTLYNHFVELYSVRFISIYISSLVSWSLDNSDGVRLKIKRISMYHADPRRVIFYCCYVSP